MTSVDDSNHLDQFKDTNSFNNFTPKLKFGDYVRNADKHNIFSKEHASNWNRELFKVNKLLRTQPPTCKREDISGEIIEGKNYGQELLNSNFAFESKNNVLES